MNYFYERGKIFKEAFGSPDGCWMPGRLPNGRWRAHKLLGGKESYIYLSKGCVDFKRRR